MYLLSRYAALPLWRLTNHHLKSVYAGQRSLNDLQTNLLMTIGHAQWRHLDQICIRNMGGTHFLMNFRV